MIDIDYLINMEQDSINMPTSALKPKPALNFGKPM